MAITKGSAAKVNVATSDAAGNTIAGVISVTFSDGKTDIDTTTINNSVAAKKRIVGLNDYSLSITCLLDFTDTNGQVVMNTGWTNGSTVYLRYLYDGTNGIKGSYVITSRSIATPTDGPVTVTYECKCDGTIATAAV